MSSNKTERSVKRFHDQLAINRQLVICKVNRAHMRTPVGAFRKRHALNCGRPKCLMCCNPRRTWGHVTVRELRVDEAFKYDLSFI